MSGGFAPWQTLSGGIFAFPAKLTPSGTTQTIDWTTGGSQVLDLSATSGNLTVTLTNPANGGRYVIKTLGQVARTVTWPVTVKWPGGVAPVVTATLGAVDIINLVFDGTNYYGTFAQAFA